MINLLNFYIQIQALTSEEQFHDDNNSVPDIVVITMLGDQTMEIIYGKYSKNPEE